MIDCRQLSIQGNLMLPVSERWGPGQINGRLGLRSEVIHEDAVALYMRKMRWAGWRNGPSGDSGGSSMSTAPSRMRPCWTSRPARTALSHARTSPTIMRDVCLCSDGNVRRARWRLTTRYSSIAQATHGRTGCTLKPTCSPNAPTRKVPRSIQKVIALAKPATMSRIATMGRWHFARSQVSGALAIDVREALPR
jgi:hypothetical protein